MQITAGFLYHFTLFTEWATQPTDFHYCVYDDTDVTALLRESYSDKTYIEVKDINTQSDVNDCQLIYFPHPAPADFFKKMKQLAILSVGTQQDFIQLGGIIYLYEDNQKLRFYINNTTAINAGLKISSQLLQLSREP